MGDISSNLETQINNLFLTQIESLAEAIFDFESLGDLINWLNFQSQENPS